MDIKTELQQLFQLTNQLSEELKSQNFENFQVIEQTYSEKLKELLDVYNAATLISVLPELKTLEIETQEIQNKAQKSFDILKTKSLEQQRNKKKINAYKK
jgi:predicted ATP-grasp superfamily ATP-dependent carboligase